MMNNYVFRFLLIAFCFVSLEKVVMAQAPGCATALAAPIGNGTPYVFNWAAGTGTITEYRIYIGTTTAATELINGVSIAAPTTSYTYTGTFPCGTTYWKVVPYNGATPATGCAVNSFSTGPENTSVFGTNTWNAYVFDFAAPGTYTSNDLGWNYYKGSFTYAGVSATDPSFNTTTLYANSNPPSSATGYTGCPVAGTPTNGVQMKRHGFPPNTYQLNFASDDAGYLYVNGALVSFRTGAGSQTNVWSGNLDASSTIDYHYKNNLGNGSGSLTFIPFTPGTIAGTQSLCNGNNDPAAFTSTAAAAGSCSPITYQWQSDPGCTGTFTDILGATAATYDAPAGLAQTTCYRRMIADPICGKTLYSNVLTVTLYPTTPGNPSVFPSNTWNGYVYDFRAAGGYTTNDLGWTDYKGYFSYAGMSATDPSFTTATIYTTANLPTSAPGYQGCRVVNADTTGVQFKREGFPPGTYQLSFSSNDAGYLYLNGSSVPLSSRTTAGNNTNFWIGTLDATSKLEFHYKNNTGTALGSLTFVSVPTPTLVPGTISGNQFLCYASNDPAAFTSTLAGSGTCGALVYQWQSDPGCTGTFTDIAGATAATYDVPAGLTQTTCYRRSVVDINCGRTAFTNTVTVTVYGNAVPGNPSVFPSNTWNGYVYDFTNSGGYNSNDLGWTDYRGFYTYPGVSGTDPSFNTVSIYTTPNLPTSAPGYVGCPVTNTLRNGAQLKRQGFPAGTYRIELTADDASYLYINGQLMYSKTSGGTGSTTNAWTGNLDASSTIDFHYKNNNTAPGLGQLTFVLIPTPVLIPGTISKDQILCPGNNPLAFTSITPASGTCGPLVYQWQEDVGCTGTFTDIAGATAAIYDAPVLTQSTCYRRAVLDPNCGRTDYTNIVTVTITTVPQGDPSVFPTDTWNGYVYDFSVVGYGGGLNAGWTDYKGFFTYQGVSATNPSFHTPTIYSIVNVPSSGPNYAGCQVGNSLSGAQIKRQGFPAGTYRIDFNSDDAGYLYVNDILVYGRTGCCTLVNNVWTGNLDATSKIDYRYKNDGGAGFGTLTFTLVTPTIPLNEGSIALNGASTVCAGDVPSAIVSSENATSGCYLYPYQWQANEGSGFQDIVGATSAGYAPGPISVTTTYRRKITDACGDESYTNTVTITVGPSIVPDPSIFGTNSWIAYVYNQPNFAAAALSGSYTDPGASAIDPSFNSMNLWNTNLAPSLAASYVGCQVGVDNHSVAYKRRGFAPGTYTLSALNDDACQLYVNGILVYTRNSWTPTFINSVWTGNLDANSTIDFRWTEGGGGSNGAISFTIVPVPGPYNGGTIANAVTQVCSGDAAPAFTSSSIASGGCYVNSYQWQLNTGSGFTDIAGATSLTYTPVAQTVSTTYRRMTIDACNQIAYSNSVVIGIGSPTPPDPTIFGSNVWNVYTYNDVNFTPAQLRGKYVDNGFSAADPSFDSRNMWVINGTPSDAAGYVGCSTNQDQHSVIYKRRGFPAGIYRLDYNSDDAGSVYIDGVLVYTSVSWGALVTNIWTGPLTSTSTIEFRWADTGGGQSYGNLMMTYPVTPTALLGGTIANVVSQVCSGNTPPPFTSTAAASGGCYSSYQWQYSSTATGGVFVDISGATAATYAPAAGITITTNYRRKVMDICGTTAYSNTRTITIGTPAAPALTFATGSWSGYVYNSRTVFTAPNLVGKYTEPNFSSGNYSFDTRNSWLVALRATTAAGYVGCQTGNDNFGVSFRQTGFTPGTYQIDIDGDDDITILLNGTIISPLRNGAFTNAWTGSLTAASQIEIKYGEGAGNAYCKVTFTSTTAPATLTPGTIGTNQTICTSVVPATLTSVADAASGCSVAYQWQYSTTSATGPWTNTGGNTKTLSFAPPGLTQTTYYQRTVTDACGRSATSNVVTVTVNPIPGNAGTMTGTNSVCSGQTGVAYSIPAVANATTYTWLLPTGASIASGPGTNSITVNWGSATSGTVTVRPDNSCGVGLTSSMNVTVTPSVPAAADPISGLSTVCEGQFNVLYSVAAVPGAASYVWTLPAGASITSGVNTRSIRVQFGAAAGNITVTPQNNCGPAATATSLAITMNPLPGNAGAMTGITSVCPNEAGVTYSIPAVANATSYAWIVPAGASITSGLGTNSITVTFGTTSGNVTVTPKNDCGQGNATIKVVAVRSLGTPGAMSGSAIVCQGRTGNIYSITTVTGASGYTWTIPPGALITAGANTRSITVTMGTTSGDVTVTPYNVCQVGTTVTKAVDVSNTIPPSPGPITGPLNPCVNESGVVYSIDPIATATNYVWVLPGGATITSGVNTNAITVTFAASGGNIRVLPSNFCGNSSSNSVQLVTLKPLVGSIGAITGITSICKGQTGITYSIPAVANALTYTWNIPAGAVITSGGGTRSIIVSYASASVTSGTVSVEASNTCGSVSNSVPVSISNSCPYTWIGTVSTDWSDPSNWSLGYVPTNLNSVTIPSGTPFHPALTADVPVNSITNNSIIDIGAHIFSIYGNLINNGTINTVSGSKVVFTGSSAQAISGSATNTTLQHVQVNNTSGLTLNTALSVKGTVTLSNGVITTKDTLTLLFDDGGNIAYNVSDLGSISGKVKGRRMMNNATGSHYIGSPFNGVQIGQIVNTTPMFANNRWMVYTKNFATQGWTAVRTLTEPMSLGRGFSVGMLAPAPIILSGTYTHNQTIASETFSNTAASKSILIANPYPSTIDWDGAGWTKTNVADAIYFWNPYSSTTASYIAGDGVNGGTRYIPAMQAFTVLTTGGGGMSGVTMSPMCRVIATQAFWRTSNTAKVMIEAVSESGLVDQTIVRFRDDALEIYETEVDALKIMNASLAPSLYTYSSFDEKNIAINTYPTVEQETEIPLHLKVQTNGKYVLRFPNFNLEGYQLILEDKQERVQKVIDGSEDYELSALKTDSVNRFVLKFSSTRNTVTTGTKGSNSKSGLQIYSAPTGFMVQTNQYGGTNALIEILDVTGNKVGTIDHAYLQSGNTMFAVSNLPSGAYVIRVYTTDEIFTGNIAVIK